MENNKEPASYTVFSIEPEKSKEKRENKKKKQNHKKQGKHHINWVSKKLIVQVNISKQDYTLENELRTIEKDGVTFRTYSNHILIINNIYFTVGRKKKLKRTIKKLNIHHSRNTKENEPTKNINLSFRYRLGIQAILRSQVTINTSRRVPKS